MLSHAERLQGTDLVLRGVQEGETAQSWKLNCQDELKNKTALKAPPTVLPAQ